MRHVIYLMILRFVAATLYTPRFFASEIQLCFRCDEVDKTAIVGSV